MRKEGILKRKVMRTHNLRLDADGQKNAPAGQTRRNTNRLIGNTMLILKSKYLLSLLVLVSIIFTVDPSFSETEKNLILLNQI